MSDPKQPLNPEGNELDNMASMPNDEPDAGASTEIEINLGDSSPPSETQTESNIPSTESKEKLIAPPEGETPDGGDDDDDDQEEAVPEKLADDEGPQDPFWKRVIFRIFPKLKRIEERRILVANDDLYNLQFKYTRNTVTTSKYNIITFLPLNLFEQFLRVANTYFLILLILQVIPSVSAVPWYTTLIPLAGVLAITAIKDAYDDILRHISDYKVNHRVAHILCHDTEVIKDYSWKDVSVGDVLRLEKDDFITADMLLLSSSEPNSLAYIETAELDGETNLKVRQVIPETAVLEDDHEKLTSFRGKVECEPPNNRLNKFVGTVTIDDNIHSLDNESILLRGCRLRNTKWIYGLVVYAGHDTKLVQNSGRTKFKRTHLDLLINKLVIFILCFLGLCVFICLIGSAIFETVYGQGFTVYAAYYNEFQDNPAELAFLQVLSNLIVLNTFVPISLYVSVEVIRLSLSLMIRWDVKMYYEAEDIPANARTTSLNEELGQIEYIFSDKTGTLTQNVMTFLKCAIDGNKYGEVTSDDKDMEQEVATGAEQPAKRSSTSSTPSESQRCNLQSWNSYADPNFVFYDQNMVSKCRNRDPGCDEFFKLLALCHTVIPSMETGTITYNAQSPDEAALVSAARNFGYVFKARSPFTITLDMLNLGQEVTYEMMNILDFNNERKRMSVIVKHDDKITLYCKGADSVVMARLDQSQAGLQKKILEELGEYAREGLRTLVCAKKDLTLEEYSAWAAEYQAASILQENRDQAVDIVYNKIEQNLIMVGTTAIEDKLQDGVPDAIANLAKADIKIWVLTGDKQETAINIGYSTKLLTSDMRVFIVDADTSAGVIKQLRDITEEMNRSEERAALKESKKLSVDPFEGEEEEQDDDDEESDEMYDMDDGRLGPPFGIVLNGHSLRFALRENVKFDLLETACRCKAVICCRVTPLQKKKVVDLVKKHKKAVTLAIGDGANDVGMIKAAHVGVGISGREGQQAVLSSDYSFGQFRFLERLLLVHGRWSYHRMTTFLRYFFYKNFAFTFSQFIFAFFCGFTAQTLYDPNYISVYNVIYTSLPVIGLAVLDQDVDENNCYRYPQLYIAGQKNRNFNPQIFVRSVGKGIYVAFVMFFLLFGMTSFNEYSSGYEWDYQSFGLAASGALTIIVNLQIALDTNHWNPVMHLFIWGSIIAWFVVVPFMSADATYRGFLPLFDFYGGVALEVLSSATFWFYWPVAVMLALAPTIISRIIRLDLFPQLVDDVRLLQKKEGKNIFKRVKIHRKPSPTLRRSASVKRSGYAFSHEQGFGNMITTGQIFGMNQQEVQKEHHRRLSQFISSTPSSPTHSTHAAPFSVGAGVEESLTTAGAIAVVGTSEKNTVTVDVHTPPLVEEPEVDNTIEDMVKVEVGRDSEGEREMEASVTLPGKVDSSEHESGASHDESGASHDVTDDSMV